MSLSLQPIGAQSSSYNCGDLSDGSVSSSTEDLEGVPAQKILTSTDFPGKLVDAIGRDKLDQMPQVTVTEKTTGYLDGCFSLEMIPESGAIKGTDQHGRVFVTFAVTNPNYKKVQAERSDIFSKVKKEEVALFTVFQRYLTNKNINEAAFYRRWCRELPTNDSRFYTVTTEMDDELYQAIREVFNGTHPDLTLGVKKQSTPWFGSLPTCTIV